MCADGRRKEAKIEENWNINKRKGNVVRRVYNESRDRWQMNILNTDLKKIMNTKYKNMEEQEQNRTHVDARIIDWVIVHHWSLNKPSIVNVLSNAPSLIA